MASVSIHPKELDDLTECPICTEVFKDPRVLPCIHTFCLKCISGCYRGKRPGDKIPCPLCRKEFSAPADPNGLQKNFFIEKLLTMRELASGGKQNLCDVCSDHSTSKDATFYCMACQEKMCESCKTVHCRMKATASHKVVRLGEEMKQDKNIWKDVPAKCGIHEDKTLEIYCSACKVVICMMCYIEKHNSHNCTNLVKISEDIRLQVSASLGPLVSGIEKCQGMLHAATDNKINLMEQISKAEKDVCEQAERLKGMIDNNKQKLLDELKSLRATTLKEITTLSADIERQKRAMEGFQKYVNEMLSKGTSCDIVQTSSGLLERARELMAFDTMTRTLESLSNTTIVFKPSNLFVHTPASIGQVERFIKHPVCNLRYNASAPIPPMAQPTVAKGLDRTMVKHLSATRNGKEKARKENWRILLS